MKYLVQLTACSAYGTPSIQATLISPNGVSELVRAKAEQAALVHQLRYGIDVPSVVMVEVE